VVLPSRAAQLCREHATRESVQNNDGVVATASTNENNVPASLPTEPDILGVVDDQPARTRVVRGDGHRFMGWQHWRRARTCLDDARTEEEQQQGGQARFHVYVNSVVLDVHSRPSSLGHRWSRPR
jgi:hypothetical protein